MCKFLTITSILIAVYADSFAQMHYTPRSPAPANLNNQSYRYTGSGWEKGGYTDLQGNQHNGFIMVGTDKNKTSVIGYKKDRHDDNVLIPVDSIKRVIYSDKSDTFVVSHSPLLNNLFIREVIVNNQLKLYNQPVEAAYSAYGVKDVWYYGTNKDDLTLLDKKNFINIMPQIMTDRPYVVKNILNKQYKYSDMVDLITYYQTGREPWKDRDNQ